MDSLYLSSGGCVASDVVHCLQRSAASHYQQQHCHQQHYQNHQNPQNHHHHTTTPINSYGYYTVCDNRPSGPRFNQPNSHPERSPPDEHRRRNDGRRLDDAEGHV